MKITINTHYSSREEVEELKEFLDSNYWDYSTDEVVKLESPFRIVGLNEIDTDSGLVILNEKIFDEELSEYRIVHRETEIDNLYRWVGETKSESNKVLMKEDLKQLEGITDEYVLSSVSTNDFVSQEDSNFNELIEEIIKINLEL